MRVYFLGAGASKSFYPGPSASGPWLGLPTARELTLNHLLNSSNYENPPCGAIASLRRFVGLQEVDPARSVEDILEIFDGHDQQFRDLRICLMSRLWVDDRSNTGPLVNWLACVRRSVDALLTTNYDMVLERGIRKLTKPVDPRLSRDRGLIDYGVTPELLAPEYRGLARGASPNSILLLKLHGSISWAYCETCKMGELDPAYRDLAGNALAGNENCVNCSSLLLPVLVGPGKKQYGHPIIQSILRSAKGVLEQADEIVFAGFSLSPSDRGIRELLAQAHRIARTTRVFVVDQDPKAPKVYKEVYGDAVEDIEPMDWKRCLEQRALETSANPYGC